MLMNFITDRAKRYLEVIQSTIRTEAYFPDHIMFSEGKEKPFEWRKFEDEQWGGYDKWAWFRTKFELPEHYEGKTVVLQLVTGDENAWNVDNPQFTVYINGRAVQAFDTNHTILYLTDRAEKKQKFDIEYFGYSSRTEHKMTFKPVLYVHNREAQRIYYNLETAMLAADMYEKNTGYRAEIENYLTEAMNLLDLRCPMSEDYFKSIEAANKYLEEEFYEKFCENKGPIINCIGHTHIDVAWLWTTEQTRQKAVRSFATALMLMERYPEFRFSSSQPQLYQYVKEEEPELYERIKERVREGRWEVEGAMWLEADCNLISGESFIRQLLHGKRFIKQEFGKDSKVLFLPDVFGYSSALPQILQKSGVDAFVTSKISWNECNAIPYQTFQWQGIDGTEIFTQFIWGGSAGAKLGDKDSYHSTYNGRVLPNAFAYSWEHYDQKNINNEIMTTIGYGDGGGGVTEEMLERYRRLCKGIPGTPTARMSGIGETISRIKKNVEGKRLPKWVGELYLEMHRGTYTSIAKNKKYNRICEFLLQHTETVSLMNHILLGGSYPKEELYHSWETVLRNQFHDIIPGSSIKEVYDTTDIEYAKLVRENETLSDHALREIASSVGQKGVLVYNPTGMDRSDIVEYNGKRYFVENVPAYGWIVSDKFEEEKPESDLIASIHHLENRFFAVDIDSEGCLTRIYDKINEREVLKPGERGNVIQAYDDHPRVYDNWEISNYYTEKMWEVNDVVSVEVEEVTSLLASLRISKKFLNSTIVQKVIIYRDIPRIDFDTEIHWKEHHILLKAAFPVDILSDKASYEIQYGSIERPTHTNTSWDEAKFEVCAQKWADLSEDGYGAAVLNDCKYGYDIHDGVMKITLLKSGTYPNPEADTGKHVFRYSFMPHSGGWREGGVVREGYAVNCPLKTFEAAGGGILPEKFSLVTSSAENVIVSAVKYACDSDDIILRVYEAYGRRTKVKLQMGIDIKEVYDSNFIETENYDEMEKRENSFEFIIKPYEIKTFRISKK